MNAEVGGVVEPGKIRVGISSCLLGHEVRFDGGQKRDAFITRKKVLPS